jgi:outer membrane protein assembly factor BamB
MVADEGIAKQWPANGPRELWRRPLGDGYSSISTEDNRLYTMYRAKEKERVICLDAETGKTIWEHAYDAKPAQKHMDDFGKGPNATPLIIGGRLYTAGVAGLMKCLDIKTGQVFWSQDLLGKYGATIPEFGYSSSPIEYKDTVIALVGGEKQSIIAFDKTDGHVVWKNLSFKNSFSTPRILKILGEDHLVAFMSTEVIGVDPSNGKLKWQYPSVNQWKQNICLPIQIDDDELFVSSLAAGTRSLKLRKEDGRIAVEETWSTTKVEFMYTSLVGIGDYVYGSSGYQASALLSALNMRTGKIAWRERGFARAHVVGVGDRLIILDEKGVLALATANPERLTIHSRCKILEEKAWTPPTIVGTKLYARDRKQIVALDLR